MSTLDELRAARWARTGRDATVHPLPAPSPMPEAERERIKTQGEKRVAYMRDYNAKRRALARAYGLKHYAPASPRFLALAREAQDAAIARWCAEWRETQRRAVVGRYGVRHAR